MLKVSKKNLFLIIFCASLNNLNAGTESSSLSNFVKDLRIFKPDAPWITEQLINLNLKDFKKGFKEVIELLTENNKRWFYFCDKKEDFDSKKYFLNSLWQCIYFDKWLSKLFIDISSGTLFIESSYLLPDNYITFEKYITLLESDGLIKSKYYQFYAFYMDCLSSFFCDFIIALQESTNDIHLNLKYFSIAKKCFNKMESLLSKLRSSCFHDTYKIILRRYEEIIKLSEEEKIQNLIKP